MFPVGCPPILRRWLGFAACALPGVVLAQAVTPAAPIRTAPPPAAMVPAATGPAWSNLSLEQRTALAPLQRDWATIDAGQKRKWLEVAARFPGMPAGERARVQERMTDWVRMTPQERGRARLRFQQAQRVEPGERQARWEAYQALPPAERRQLATKSQAPAPDTARRAEARSPQGKSNLVPNPAYAAPPKPVAPIVVQARPGASTTLMSRKPAPPPHQQTGMPKIVATPEFVDSATLLPQRGAQGAAIRAPAPRPTPREPAG
jgi:hypothetical protein